MSVQDSETLRQQFKLIQEQQQKKLLARKQKKLKNSTKESDETPVVSKNNWEPEDDLDLRLDTVITNGEELNVHSQLQELQQSLRILKDENGRLYKLLGERDEEMRIIRKQRDNERKALAGTGVAADTAAGKIVELSKKNRELSADLQSEKNKVRQLTRKVQDLESQVKLFEASNVPQTPKDDGNGLSSEEAKALQEKLKSTTSKMSEYRNQCEGLKKELKVTHKVLSKELGEHVNVASLLNDTSGWRGRQQQINSLQNKVAELKGQLQEVARSGSTLSSSYLLRSSMATPSYSSSQYDDKHKSVLRKIEKEKKDSLEKTKEEFDKLSEEHSHVKQKLEASKARNKVLANDLKMIKSQNKTLLEKGAHDDELVAALMREQQQLKEAYKKPSSSPPPQPQVIVTQDNTMINHLRQICQQRDERIKQLEQELEDLKQTLQNEIMERENQDHKPRPQTVSVGCCTENQPTLPSHSSSDTSINRLVLEEKEMQSFSNNDAAPGTPNRRNVPLRNGLNSPSSRNGKSRYSIPPTPPSAGRLSSGRRNSASNSEEVHGLRCQVQEFKSLHQAAEVERDRLLELVSLLQKRINEESSKCLDVTTKFQEQRRMNAHMEKQLGRVQSTTKIQNTAKNKVRGSSSQKFTDDSEELEETKTWLEIQKDENDDLKEALNSTLKAKEEDLKYYQDMMEQTKKIFLQGLRQFRQGSAPS
ncbi:coiled-coil domain-containing protein 13-like [Actinia tenebrosa]|uniref:Coiled-coil domain-containing protein 13-like n=1 Tax=Actinia tenebrosa TaxID=6105 RepID=A0A6P8J5N0_ACTTE|nr:coiled-coil domain-containing protein 13-like [Actinia tenebrosa]